MQGSNNRQAVASGYRVIYRILPGVAPDTPGDILILAVLGPGQP